MDTSKIFDYKSDWFQFFEGYLKNEYIEDENLTKNKIKAHIIESNFETITKFAQGQPQIQLIKSKEKDFYNIILKEGSESYFLYVDTEDPRFWIIHNIEAQERIKNLIAKIFWRSYLQDKIYMSNQSMEKYWKTYCSDSLGISLKFEQLFFNDLKEKPISSEVDEDIGFTLRFWPKRLNSMNYFLEKFRKINLPISYKSLNYVVQDIDGEILLKEDFYYDGGFTINKGKDFYSHIKLINLIRNDYSSKIKIVEDFRFDWSNSKGDLFIIEFNKTLDPSIIYNTLKSNFKKFRIYIFELYKENDYTLFDCVDGHTGGQFNLQIFNDKLYIKLKKDSCGNIVFRLFSNLQRYLSPNCKLNIDNQSHDLLS